MLAKTTFASDRHFGLVDTEQRGARGEYNSSGEGKVLSALIPTIQGISFCGLSITHVFSCDDSFSHDF